MLTGEPWERVGIDLTGPHPTSTSGNKYIVTLIDHFIKWIEIWPARNQEAETVAKFLVDRVFCVHGTPIQILTDRGANFESELFQEICRRLAVDKVRTTAYKPSTNGNIERYHSTLNAVLAKWIASDQRDWDKHLAAVAFAYRTSVHDSTGFTPYFLMYDREARLPSDLMYGPPLDTTDNETSPVDFVARQQDILRCAYAFDRGNREAAAERRSTHTISGLVRVS